MATDRKCVTCLKRPVPKDGSRTRCRSCQQDFNNQASAYNDIVEEKQLLAALEARFGTEVFENNLTLQEALRDAKKMYLKSPFIKGNYYFLNIFRTTLKVHL